MGRGRKRAPKTRTICFRVTHEQYEILKLVAEYSGMELSDLMRTWVLMLILRFKMGPPMAIPEVDTLEEALLRLSEEKEGKLRSDR